MHVDDKWDKPTKHLFYNARNVYKKANPAWAKEEKMNYMQKQLAKMEKEE